MRQLKPATTAAQQIDLLRHRGMSVDETTAKQWLRNVSYYRLSAYWYPARVLQTDGSRSDSFAPGTSFNDAVALYEADRKLRTLVHDGMERIEITMRTRIGELLCTTNPLLYTNPAHFRPSFDHAEWMTTAVRRVRRAGAHNEAIRHYQSEYGGQYPFWVLAEVLDFADISRLLEDLVARDQREIAEGLDIVIDLDALSKSQKKKAQAESPLVRWMEQLTIIRNTCAHHGRLWNKSFAPAPTAALRTMPSFADLPEGQSERLFGALRVMTHILRRASPGTTWPIKVSQLVASSFLSNPLVTRRGMGISQDWDGSL